MEKNKNISLPDSKKTIITDRFTFEVTVPNLVTDFKFNNYISRYHQRHTDLMDLLSLYNGRAVASLDQIALLCGFPGKQGMSGAQVWPAYLEGRIEEIRHYCLTDVLNTWLVWCRFQHMRGVYSLERYEHEVILARKMLGEQSDARWGEFLTAWKGL